MKMHPLTRSQKNLALVLFVVAILIVLASVGRTKSDAHNISIETPVAELSSPLKNTDKKIKAPAIITVTHNVIAAKKTDVVAAAPEKVSAWKAASASTIPSIVLNEKIVAYEAIEVTEHPDKFPQVGEQLALPLLHGAEVHVDVQSVSTSPNGDQSWSGHLQGYGTDYPVIMTYGEHSVFAMITTPEGSYSMESVNGTGWVYKNPSELELSSTNTKDFLEVPDAIKHNL